MQSDELPPGWTQEFSTTHGRVYYLNSATKVTQWHAPVDSQASPELVSAQSAAPLEDVLTPREKAMGHKMLELVEDCKAANAELVSAHEAIERLQSEQEAAAAAAYERGFAQGKLEARAVAQAEQEARMRQTDASVASVREVMQHQHEQLLEQLQGRSNQAISELQQQLFEAQHQLAAAQASADKAHTAKQVALSAAASARADVQSKQAAEEHTAVLQSRIAAEAAATEAQSQLHLMQAQLDSVQQELQMCKSAAQDSARQAHEQLLAEQAMAARKLATATSQYRSDLAEAEAANIKAMRKEAENRRLEVSDLTSRLQAAETRIRELQSELIDAQGRMRVYARVRPSSDIATEQAVAVTSDQHLVLRDKKGRDQHFEMDLLFGEASTQAQLWKETEPLVSSVLRGHNCAVMAYGQTGSGKTYTMQGTAQEPGIVRQALAMLLPREATAAQPAAVQVGLRVVEIYNEQIRDLQQSSPSASNLAIRHLSTGADIPDAVILPVHTLPQALAALQAAESKRALAAHNKNNQSSRSHLVVTLFILQLDGHHSCARSNGPPAQAAASAGVGVSTASDVPAWLSAAARLHLIDLAGSERLSVTGATGHVLKEAQHINKSLSSLGDVMHALAAQSGGSNRRGGGQHVPFRNSKLTHLLQPTLTSGGRVLLLVTLTATRSDAHESSCTLQFAQRCKAVTVGTADPAAVAREQRLLQQIKRLEAKLGV